MSTKDQMRHFCIDKLARLISENEDRGELNNWLAAERVVNNRWRSISREVLQWRDSISNQEEFDCKCGKAVWKFYKELRPIYN